MKKKQLTQEEREDIRIVMEATHQILPLYEQLNAAENLTEEEKRMLVQLRQALEDALTFSGRMLEQIHTLRFENAIDHLFNHGQKSGAGDSELSLRCEADRQLLVKYLQATIDQKLN